MKRAERTNDRLLFAIAKDIHKGLKTNTLDKVTLETFKWKRLRKTAAERETEAISKGIHSGPRLTAEELASATKLADKGRVRRIKDKVRRVL